MICVLPASSEHDTTNECELRNKVYFICHEDQSFIEFDVKRGQQNHENGSFILEEDQGKIFKTFVCKPENGQRLMIQSEVQAYIIGKFLW